MKRYSAWRCFTINVCLGEVEAENEQEALEKAHQLKSSPTLCGECSTMFCDQPDALDTSVEYLFESSMVAAKSTAPEGEDK